MRVQLKTGVATLMGLLLLQWSTIAAAQEEKSVIVQEAPAPGAVPPAPPGSGSPAASSGMLSPRLLPRPGAEPFNRDAYQSARALRNSGIGLVVVGGVAALVGLGLGLHATSCLFDTCSSNREAHAAVGLAISGMTAGGLGAILWPIGHRRMKRLRLGQGLQVEPQLAPTAGGFNGGLRFRF